MNSSVAFRSEDIGVFLITSLPLLETSTWPTQVLRARLHCPCLEVGVAVCRVGMACAHTVTWVRFHSPPLCVYLDVAYKNVHGSLETQLN